MNEFQPYNERTIDLLRQFKWKKDNPDYVAVAGQPISQIPHFWGSAQQINAMTIFGQWFYSCLDEQDPLKTYLDFFMANCYYSEDFIWNNNGLMQVYYKEGLEVIRGSDRDIAQSGWNVDSERAKQFPVLNSCAADTLIALVLYMLDDECAFYIGQEQQNFVSTTILSRNWALGVETPWNPTIWKDAVKQPDWVDPRRHRFVFGPITWLSMALDIRQYVNDSQALSPMSFRDKYQSYIEKGKELWGRVSDNIPVNKNILQYIETHHIKIDEPYSKFQQYIIKKALKITSGGCGSFHQYKLMGKLLKYGFFKVLKKICANRIETISYYSVKHAKDTLEDIYELFEDEDDEDAVLQAAEYIQEFYNPTGTRKGLPFIKPPLEEVYLD